LAGLNAGTLSTLRTEAPVESERRQIQKLLAEEEAKERGCDPRGRRRRLTVDRLRGAHRPRPQVRIRLPPH